jgi:two-component system, NarL family, nitrate/nitrite response regulator NarL
MGPSLRAARSSHGDSQQTPDRDRQIRTLIVTRMRLLRDGLAEILDRSDRIAIVGTAHDADSGLGQVRSLRPDVALLDLTGEHSVCMVRAWLDELPGLNVVAVTRDDDEAALIACAEAGVAGYVTCESSLVDLEEAIEHAARAELLCSPRIAAALMRRVGALAARRTADIPASRLTARELEVLELIDTGLSNKQIAGRLRIELATVKNHVHNILEKLCVSRRSEAAAILRDGRSVLVLDRVH